MPADYLFILLLFSLLDLLFSLLDLLYPSMIWHYQLSLPYPQFVYRYFIHYLFQRYCWSLVEATELYFQLNLAAFQNYLLSFRSMQAEERQKQAYWRHRIILSNQRFKNSLLPTSFLKQVKAVLKLDRCHRHKLANPLELTHQYKKRYLLVVEIY